MKAPTRFESVEINERTPADYADNGECYHEQYRWRELRPTVFELKLTVLVYATEIPRIDQNTDAREVIRKLLELPPTIGRAL